jgi:hypothetical protein
MRSARVLLNGIVDYAGLFPPASLDMERALRAYADYLSGPYSELLGKFIVPVSRLDELSEVGSSMFSRDGDPSWRISVIVGSSLAAARVAARDFNARHRNGSVDGNAVCDAFEALAADADAVREALREIPVFFELYLEVPAAIDPAPAIKAMSGTRAAAKIRTGGVTRESIPSSSQVLRFMRECHNHGVPFKATAGLHHAIGSEYPLTYDMDSPRAEMFGYLNVFVGAAAIEAEWDDTSVLEILETRDPAVFRFDADGVSVNGRKIEAPVLAGTRERFALSFGSCSFTEPVDEARALSLL